MLAHRMITQPTESNRSHTTYQVHAVVETLKSYVLNSDADEAVVWRVINCNDM